MRTIFTSTAEEEYDAAIFYYSIESDELARRFVNSITKELSRVVASPFAFKRYGKRLRLLICSEFPYKILYEPPVSNDVEVVRILAIFHHSRNPRHLQGRR